VIALFSQVSFVTVLSTVSLFFIFWS